MASLRGCISVTIFAACSAGCTQFPRAIYTNQVDPFEHAPPVRGVPPSALHNEASACADRANRHLKSAQTSTYVRYGLTALGGAVGGGSGIVAGVAPKESTKEVAGWFAFGGGAVALGTTIVVPMISDPATQLGRFSNNSSNFDAAAVAVRTARAVAEPTVDERHVLLSKYPADGPITVDLSDIGESCEVIDVRGTWSPRDGANESCADVRLLGKSIEGGNKLVIILPIGSTLRGTCIYRVRCTNPRAVKEATESALAALRRCVNDEPANPVKPSPSATPFTASTQ